MTNRYDTSGNSEGQFQIGSDNTVLLNKLGITNASDMDQVELQLLEALYDSVLSSVTEDQGISISDICEWHRKWLGNVYEWAGRERSVNIGKADFQFAAAAQIPRLFNEFDEKYLRIYTPCNQLGDERLVEAMGIVHVEFILIHPFREGNGRIARLLADIMALQANKPELDFSAWDKNKADYFAAIKAGMNCDYEPIKALVKQVLLDSERVASE